MGVTVPSGFPKQAIVVIHGMGEQKPMDTIKNFAHAVWTADSEVHDNGLRDSGEIWSKPDDRTGSLELRRLTTRESTPIQEGTYPGGARQDFYELYWADLSGGSTLGDVQNWVRMLLLRNPFTRVPRRMMTAWLVLWIVVLVILLLVSAAALPAPAPAPPAPELYDFSLWNYPPYRWLAPIPGWILAGIVAVLGYFAHTWVVASFGRVVRYTRALPDNIAARKAIRERGLALFDDLHRAEYDRIIVVGHSLGSLLAYDLVSYYWATHAASYTVSKAATDEFALLCTLEKLAGSLATEKNDAGRETLLNQYREVQRAFCRLLRTRPRPTKKEEPDRRWLITDLITVGCPLGHTDFLLANSPRDRAERVAARELAICPPIREELDPAVREAARTDGLPLAGDRPALFSFPTKTAGEWQLHHAAQFAAVRWTNIHDPARLVAFGDVISAPAAPIFGDGVIDIDLRKLRGQSLRFTHTRYWAEAKPGKPPPPHLVELRTALDLAAKAKL
jgi:hypothetical protein